MKALSRIHPVAMAIGFLLLVGCGGGVNPFKSVPISGAVTYEDGSRIPVDGMELYFYSQQPPVDGKHPRPGKVGVGSDGAFDKVTTYKYADGLVLGKHKVLISAAGAQGVIPPEYLDPVKTPLEVEVTSSGQVLDIRIPKP